MTSLRARLFFILVAATSFIWFIATVWIYFGTRSEIEGVLDARLEEAARMVASLVPDKMSAPTIAPSLTHSSSLTGYERQLTCQIWSLDGRLVARSSDAPAAAMSEVRAGISERAIDGETWRVYTIGDQAKGIRVMVGDRLGLREHLVTDLLKGLLAPALLMIPLLGLLIWTSLQRGLLPLRAIAQDLQERNANDMRPLTADDVPLEIQPVVAAFNSLFGKVGAARQHEREITAFAAHELRTPLAGIRTQAQVSLATTDPVVRDNALRQILIGIDRTTRLVRQLLALSKVDAAHNLFHEREDVNLQEVLGEILEVPPASNKKVSLDIASGVRQTSVHANRDLLVLAVRNLHENALNHMPGDGHIVWTIRQEADEIVIAVEDEGPGIPEEELPMVTNRFFRGRYKSAVGSGLGLAIVDLAVRANGARLVLQNRADRSGLKAGISWPRESGGTQAGLLTDQRLPNSSGAFAISWRRQGRHTAADRAIAAVVHEGMFAAQVPRKP
jgi:two-component system, OmpR family, sensor histidine kinase QseC